MKKASPYLNTGFRLGILGGGQLGKMLCQAASVWDLQTWILDSSNDFPAGTVCNHFVEGDFNNFDDVYAFGKQVDVLTVEIEHVNTDALQKLENEGLIVHPSPSRLNLIKDKGLQKKFYKDHELPTASFLMFDQEWEIQEALRDGAISYPFVQKSRTAGYDGRGVALIRNANDLSLLLPGPCLIEPLVPIEKEIAVIVARSPSGEIKAFPAVEMSFHPTANLVELLFCPSTLNKAQELEAVQLAMDTIAAFDLCGLLAVEMFLTKDQQILINEVAPRPHNSGHHTIESCVTSQFQQHLRAILDLPLGDTELHTPAAMVNLLGTDGHTGPTRYAGFEDCLKIKGCHIHLYGKPTTKPFRKMGHATITDPSPEKAIEKALQVKDTMKIIT